MEEHVLHCSTGGVGVIFHITCHEHIPRMQIVVNRSMNAQGYRDL